MTKSSAAVFRDLLSVSFTGRRRLPLGTFRAVVGFVSKDARRHKRAWFVGVCTVFLVVLFVCLLQNLLLKWPLIFLRLSEENVGEMDILLLPQLTNESSIGLLNHTHIATRLEAEGGVDGTFPRWVFPLRVSNRDEPSRSLRTVALMIDSDLEHAKEQSRGWKHRPVGEQEAHVTGAVLRNIGIHPNHGERIFLNISIPEILETAGIVSNQSEVRTREFARSFMETLGFDFNQTIILNNTALVETWTDAIDTFLNSSAFAGVTATGETRITGEEIFNAFYPVYLQLLDLALEFAVVDGIDKPRGKYPVALGNVAVIDSKFIMKEVADAIREEVAGNSAITLLEAQGYQVQETIQNIENTDINQLAFMSLVKMDDRISTYTKEIKEMEKDFVHLTNDMSGRMGLDFAASWTFPLYTAILGSQFISLFLEQLFNMVLFLLISLGSMLIYSLLLSETEERTYEFGMLRALGFKGKGVLAIILTKAQAFSLPGIGVGFLFAFLINIVLAHILASYTLTDPDYSIHIRAILVSGAVGIVVPLIANIVPIRRALSKTLRDALDLSHKAFSETVVQITRLENLGLKPWVTSLAIIMVVIGFVVYYVIPYAFTFQDYPLFFTIMNLILLGLLLGLCLILYPVEGKLERLFVHCIVWGKDRRMMTLITRNMAGHRGRTGKTALMFIISLAFIIFAGAIFSLQAVTIPGMLESIAGSDVVVTATSVDYPLVRDDLEEYLNDVKGKRDPIPSAFSFATFEMQRSDSIKSNNFANLVQFPIVKTRPIGVERDYLRSTYAKYFLLTETMDGFHYPTVDGVDDVVREMIDTAGEARFEGEKSGGYYPPVFLTSFDVPLSVGENPYKHNYLYYADSVISEATRDELSVNTKTPSEILVGSKASNRGEELESSIEVLSKPRGMVYKAPGFFGFSSYRITVNFAPLLISTKTFAKMFEDAVLDAVDDPSILNHLDSAPLERCFVKLESGVSKTDREDFINELRNYVDSNHAE
eukprot:TRINITY_DN1002_c0_g1_i6.p1 TRINITY_DN1002_c0_g1~~TRINITY_DN1002_c0_g1_i6.p1  ORF type:complete len:995 (-),score=216.69 TRINITY_DN1002_c0_g1_i6:662-3646(-)